MSTTTDPVKAAALFCPRRDDMTRSLLQGPSFYFDPEAKIGTSPLPDHWREEGLKHAGITGGLPTCSYCGGLRPEDFIEALTRSDAEIHGTDKRYKAYVILPNPNAGNPRISGGSSHEKPSGTGWQKVTRAIAKRMDSEGWRDAYDHYKWVLISPDSATSQAKFYFQHVAHPGPLRTALYDWYLTHSSVFYSGAPLGMRHEHIARHPESMTDEERTALAEFQARNPGIAAP